LLGFIIHIPGGGDNMSHKYDVKIHFKEVRFRDVFIRDYIQFGDATTVRLSSASNAVSIDLVGDSIHIFGLAWKDMKELLNLLITLPTVELFTVYNSESFGDFSEGTEEGDN